MKLRNAILIISLVVLVLTVLEFLYPNANQFFAVPIVVALGLLFWRTQKLRWLFYAGLFISVIPEFQAQILGPIELHHALILICFGFFAAPWLLFAPKKMPRLTVAITIYFALGAALTLINYDSVQSWHRLSIVFFMILIAVTLPQYLKTQRDYKELFVALMFTGVFAALVGLGALYVASATGTYFESPYLHMSITEGVPRIAGPLLDSNFLGNFLLLSLSICIGLVLLGKQKKKLVTYGVLIILGAILLLTYSRSAYLGFGAALVVFAIVLGRKKLFARTSLKIASIVIAIGIAACALYPPFVAYSVYRTPSVILPTEQKEKLLLGFDPRNIVNAYIKKIQSNRRLTDEERDALLARDVSSDSLGYRILFWRAGLEMFKDHPIIGVGIGQFRYEFKNYANVTHLRQPDTHNIFIEQLAETGIIGFSLFMVVLFLAYKNFIRAARSPSRWVGVVGSIGFASLTALLVQSTLLGGLGAIPIYVLWGLASSIEPLLKGKPKRGAAKKQRIALITATTKRDGPGNMMALLIKKMDRELYEPIVITVLKGGEWDALYKTLHVRRINLGLKKPFDLLAPIILWWWLARIKPDLVHTQMIRADVYGRWAAIRAGIPISTVVHNIDNWKRSKKIGHRLMTWIDAQCLATINGIVAVSKAVKNHLVDRQGIAQDKIHVVSNGIEHGPIDGGGSKSESRAFRAKYNIPADAIVIGTTARVIHQKAPDVWLSAAIQVLSHHPDVHFIWAGQGPLLETARALVKKRGLEKSIHFIGQINITPGFLRAFDIYVLSSRFEGLPLALLEAMSAGVASIASNVSGNPEVITNNETGILVPPDNSQELATAITRLVISSELRKMLGDAGQKYVREKFSPEQMVSGYEHFYKTVITQTGLGVPS